MNAPSQVPEAASAPQAQPTSSPQPVYTAAPPTNGMAVAGFVCSFVMPLVGLILSLVSLNQIKTNHEGGKGLAIAGVVISSIFLVLGLLYFLFFIVLLIIGAASGA